MQNDSYVRPLTAMEEGTNTSPSASTASVKEPEFTLSIDRSTRRWAVFKDDFALVKAFEGYEDEGAVPALARTWLKERGWSGTFTTVYPCITKAVFRSSPARSRKRRPSPAG